MRIEGRSYAPILRCPPRVRRKLRGIKAQISSGNTCPRSITVLLTTPPLTSGTRMRRQADRGRCPNSWADGGAPETRKTVEATFPIQVRVHVEFCWCFMDDRTETKRCYRVACVEKRMQGREVVGRKEDVDFFLIFTLLAFLALFLTFLPPAFFRESGLAVTRTVTQYKDGLGIKTKKSLPF